MRFDLPSVPVAAKRAAIGAHRLHVLLQFLAEAVFLSVTRGVAGIILGTAFSKAISLAAGWPTFWAAAAVFFAYWPARAAQLCPIEALR